MSEKSAIDLSVVIVNWNTKRLLKSCLSSIFHYPPDSAFEVIVVDNASTDGSSDMVEEDFPGVILLRNEENLGFGKANNLGIKKAAGRFVLLLNSDAEVLDGSLSGLLSFMKENPGLAAAGCKLLDGAGKQEESCGSFPTLQATAATKLARVGLGLFQRWASHTAPSRRLSVDWITAACLIAKKSGLEEIGGFDERIFLYFEDADLCFRLKAAGGQIAFTPEVTIMHLRGGSAIKSSDSPKRVDRNYRSSQLYFFDKNLGGVQSAALRLILALAGQLPDGVRG